MKNGIYESRANLNIPVVAYSPLGRVILTGAIRRYEDLSENCEQKEPF